MERRTAIVTGGSRGIGYACAARLAHEGMNLVLFATSPAADHAERLVRIQAKTEMLYVQGRLDSGPDRARLLEETLARFGAVHVLVNNAGVAPETRADLLEMTEESFDRVLGINTKGTMFLTQAVARQMLRQPAQGPKRGTVINISSCSAAASSLNRGEYCVSKAGVSMLTALYAHRLAEEGIRVYEVRPGVIDTDMTGPAKAKYDALIAQGLFPIPRWGTPEDVADAVALFAGDHYLYSTGNVVDVDGGFHLRRL